MFNINPLNSLLVLVAVFAAAMLYGLHPAAAAVSVAAAVFIVFYTMIRFRGRTWRQWRQLARHRRTTTRTDALFFSNRRYAVTWDGNRMSMFLELTPPPYHVLALRTSDGEVTGVPDLPLDVIATALRQHDIAVDHISVISHGYVSASAEPYDIVYADTSSLGQFSRFRTYIEVSIRLASSLNSVDARRGDEDLAADGLGKVTYVATQRLMRLLIDNGWGARPLTTREVNALDDEISGSFDGAFENERRRIMGEDTLSRIYSSRTPHLPMESLPETASTVTVARVLTPQRHGRVHLDTFVGLTGDNPEDVTAGHGLDVEIGVQGDLLSQILPLAPYPEVLRQNTLIHYHVDDVQPAGQAFGTGIALGERKGQPRDKIFMTLGGARGSVLHAHVGSIHLRTLIMRMAAAGETVDVVLPDPYGEWDGWIRSVNSARIRLLDSPADGSAVFVDAAVRADVHPDKITIAVCAGPPPRTARHTLVAGDEGNLYVLNSGGASVTYYATAAEQEMPWLVRRESTRTS